MQNVVSFRVLKALAAMLVCGWLAGCAATPPTEPIDDPLEPINRKIYAFNQGLDNHVLKPAATGYKRVTPQPVRTGVGNFFNNLHTPLYAAYNFLQGKPADGMSDIGRFVFNSTIGLAGFIDVAENMGLRRRQESFGQTLAVWGVDEGWYLVLPILGPSTVRETAGYTVDFSTDILYSYPDIGVRYSLIAMEMVDLRARALGASRVVEQAALDPYEFIKEAYRQRKWSQVHDGNPPPPEFDDFDDDFNEE